MIKYVNQEFYTEKIAELNVPVRGKLRVESSDDEPLQSSHRSNSISLIVMTLFLLTNSVEITAIIDKLLFH